MNAIYKRITGTKADISNPDGRTVEMDKGDVPIQKEYFQLWYMQGTPYALYDNYAYVTL